MNIVGIPICLTLFPWSFPFLAIKTLADSKGSDLALKGSKFAIEFLILLLQMFDQIPGLIREHGGRLNGHPLCQFCTLLIQQPN